MKQCRETIQLRQQHRLELPDDNTVNNPATVDVPVTLPINTGVNVMVYTR